MWFITKVKYNRTNEKGLLKAVTEQYLVDADSFTETEARIYEKLEEIVIGDFDVTDISKTNYTDVFFYNDCQVWYKCKIQYYLVDESSGKEKKVTQYMLVEAQTAKEAYDRIFESLNNMLVTFTVPDVIETKIIEVFDYSKKQ
jgi:hypothetical protein